MSSTTRKIADAIEEHGSIDAYMAWLDQQSGFLTTMYHPIPTPSNFKHQTANIMDFKIFEIEDPKTQLLIRRDVTDNELPCVIVTFFAKDASDDEYQEEELIEFQTAATAQNYVRDFSADSARKFVEANLRE